MSILLTERAYKLGAYKLDLTPSEMFVLTVLCGHAHDDATEARPGLGLIEWKTGFSKRQVQRLLGSLREAGIIIPTAYSAGGKGNATVYSINLDAGIKKKPLKDDAGVTLSSRNGDAGVTVSDPKGDAGVTVSDPKGDAGVTVSDPKGDAGVTVSDPKGDAGVTVSDPKGDAGVTVSGPKGDAGVTLSGPKGDAGVILSGPKDDAGVTLSGPKDDAGVTLSGPKDDAGVTLSGRKGDAGVTLSADQRVTSEQQRVTSEQQRVTSATPKGDTGVTPTVLEPSRTVLEPSGGGGNGLAPASPPISKSGQLPAYWAAMTQLAGYGRTEPGKTVRLLEDKAAARGVDPAMVVSAFVEFYPDNYQRLRWRDPVLALRNTVDIQIDKLRGPPTRATAHQRRLDAEKSIPLRRVEVI